jgi:HK97 family phage prohead protease
MTQRNKAIRGEKLERSILELDRKAASDESRTVPAALSSEQEVERWFGRELLVHEEDAIDLSRANGLGLPLLWNHDTGTPIGRIEGMRLDPDRVLRGTLRFSSNARAKEIWTDVREGFLNGVSLGYKVQRWEEKDQQETVRVTRWQPIEASIVSVPADATVGINRSEAITMSESNGQQTEQGGGREAVAIEQYRSQFDAGKKAAEREVRQRESARMLEIEDIFSNPLIPRDEFFVSLKRSAIGEGWGADRTRKLVLDALAGNAPDLPEQAPAPDMSRMSDQQLGVGRKLRAEAGADSVDKLRGVMSDALMVRAGLCEDKGIIDRVDGSGYRGRSLLRLGEEWLKACNVDTRGLDDKGIARSMLTRTSGPHTSADFTGILANVATKSALRGWTLANTTWQMWCNTGSLPDFKQATIAGLGAFPDLDQIPRSGGPYQHASMADVAETAQLATYGKLFGISREALINDDMNEFTRVPQAMGTAAARKVNGIAYAVLTASSYVGQTMAEDSTALFHADHSNYIASGSGAAPSVATLNTALASMRKQKAPLPSGDGSAAYLNIEPAYLLTVPDLEGTSRALLQAAYDPAGTTASVSRRDAPNIWKDRLQLVVEPLLTLPTGWWLASGQNGMVDTVTVFFLNGQQAPYIEEMDNGTSDGVTFKVRIDAVARALDFRGLYFNYGA